MALATAASSLAVVLAPAAPVAAAPRPEVAAALTWLEGELAAEHAVPGFAPGSPDWGLTADAVLALAAGGRGTSAEAVATTDNLLDHVSDYATWDDLGPEYPGVRAAGALAKLLLAAEVQGVDDPAATDGFDLEVEVRATMQTVGAQAGRFSDVNPHFPGDNSNGFGQALAVLGLSYTDGGVPAPAVRFLLAQQCADGGFRLFYDAGAACPAGGLADTDATAVAVMALLVVDRTPAVRSSLVEALAWLEGEQDASGGWGGTGPTAGLNTNSTGLIAQALRAAGRTGAADGGATWTAGLALTSTEVAGTPAAAEVGAIAYDAGAKAAALADGITNRDQWRRATPQAVLALGLPDYGSIGRAPAEPVGAARTATESFVVAAYADFLERQPTEVELAAAVARVGTSAPARAALLRQLAASDEWIGRLVDRFFTDTLGRPADPGGRAYWTGQLRTGRRTVAQVAAAFYASDEYYVHLGGGTPGTWVDDLYQKLLHRTADAGGRAYWVGRAGSKGRPWVAEQMYQSLESRRDRVTALYQDLLGRGPDATGRDFWAGRVRTQGDLVLAVDLASSGEYATRATTRFP